MTARRSLMRCDNKCPIMCNEEGRPGVISFLILYMKLLATSYQHCLELRVYIIQCLSELFILHDSIFCSYTCIIGIRLGNRELILRQYTRLLVQKSGVCSSRLQINDEPKENSLRFSL